MHLCLLNCMSILYLCVSTFNRNVNSLKKGLMFLLFLGTSLFWKIFFCTGMVFPSKNLLLSNGYHPPTLTILSYFYFRSNFY